MYDYLDGCALLRKVLFTRSDELRSFSLVSLLLVIRYLSKNKKQCTFVTAYIYLHGIKRQRSMSVIYKYVEVLVIAGYIRRAGNTHIHITELGLQVLDDINRELSTSTYSRNPSAALKSLESATRKRVVKRPSL